MSVEYAKETTAWVAAQLVYHAVRVFHRWSKPSVFVFLIGILTDTARQAYILPGIGSDGRTGTGDGVRVVLLMHAHSAKATASGFS